MVTAKAEEELRTTTVPLLHKMREVGLKLRLSKTENAASLAIQNAYKMARAARTKKVEEWEAEQAMLQADLAASDSEISTATAQYTRAMRRGDELEAEIAEVAICRSGELAISASEISHLEGEVRELGEGLGAAAAEVQAKAHEVESLTEQTRRDAEALAAAAEAEAAAAEAMRTGIEERLMLTSQLEKEIALRSNLELEVAKVAAERTAKVRTWRV